MTITNKKLIVIGFLLFLTLTMMVPTKIYGLISRMKLREMVEQQNKMEGVLSKAEQEHESMQNITKYESPEEKAISEGWKKIGELEAMQKELEKEVGIYKYKSEAEGYRLELEANELLRGLN